MRHVTLFVLSLLLAGAAGATAAESPLSLPVRADRLFGGDPGTLVITDEGLAFEAREASKARRWTFDDIRAVRIPSPRRIVVETYEPTGRLHLRGGPRAYAFDVVEGAVTPDFVAAVLGRLPRPVLTTVMPSVCDAMWSGAAWHARRGGGHNGVLELHCGGVMFRSSTPAANRYWRFSDVASVLRLDGNRLEVAVRESTDIKPYVFELKADMPDAIFDALWASLHPAEEWVRERAPLRADRGVR